MTIKDINYLKLQSQQDTSKIFELIADDRKAVIGIVNSNDRSIIEIDPMNTISLTHMLDKLITEQEYNDCGVNGYDYKNNTFNTLFFNYKKNEGQDELLYQFDLIQDIYKIRKHYDITLTKHKIQQILYHLCCYCEISNEMIRSV